MQAERSRAFLKKTPPWGAAPKTFVFCGFWQRQCQNPRLAKVFCVFFSKKKRFLSLPERPGVMGLD
jgi:hypothetical protein